jgi:YVTN family beta-propeller protein
MRGIGFMQPYRNCPRPILAASTGQILTNISVGTYGWALTYAPSLGEVFAMNTASDSISVINDTNNTVVETVPLDYTFPQGLVYDPATGDLFVTNSGTQPVEVISVATNPIIDTVVVGISAAGPVYVPSLGEIFTADGYSNNVCVSSDGT